MQARLEAFAREEDSDAALSRHVQDCPNCRNAVEDILANEEFLSSFAPALAVTGESARGDLLPGDSIPGFRILREIHRGGQGVVYLARDLRAKRQVAIKMLLPGAFASPRQRARFEREIEIAARLKHPSIVTLYGTGMLPGRRLGYVMEYIDGLRLDRVVHQRWRPGADGSADASRETVRAKLDLFRRICDAMRYAHEHGVIHRDLKPDNILVDEAGMPHILDFGLARAVSDAGVTRTGEIFGTLAYAAPEQVSGGADVPDTRCDVYALGVLLYEMITGTLPYRLEGSVESIVSALVREEPRPPRAVCRGLDADLETIILKCLAKDPDRRYASAGALDEDLERYLRGDAIDAKRDSNLYMLAKAIRRHRRFATAIGGLLMLLALFAIGMAAVAQKLATQTDRAASMLAASNLERGRIYGRAGGVAAAEDLIWDELIGRVERTDLPFETLRRTDPIVRHAYWALWELYDAHPCRATIGVGAPMKEVAVRARGDLIAAGDAAGVVRVWRMPSAQLLAAWPGHARLRRTLCFSPDGRCLAAARADGAIVLYDAERGVLLDTLVAPTRREPSAFAFTSDSGFLVAGDADGSVVTWDLATGSILRRNHDHDTLVSTVSIGANDRIVATADLHRVIVRDGSGIVVDRSFTLALKSLLGLDPDGGPVAGWTDVFDFHVTSLTGEASWRGSGHVDQIDTCDADPVTGAIVSGSRDTTIRLWTRGKDGILAGPMLQGHRDMVASVRAIPGDRGIVSGSYDGVVKVWDSGPHRSFRRIGGPALTTHAIVVAPGGARLAVAREDGVIDVRDAKTGHVVRSLGGDDGHDGVVSAVAFLDDGARLVSAGYDGTVRVWDIATGSCVRAWQAHDDEVHDIKVSPDGSTLASCGRDGTIRLWSADDGALRAELRGHADRVPQVEFTPDGTVLVSTDVLGVVRLWDLTSADSARAIPPLRGSDPPARPARAVAIDPTGRLLVVGTDIGQLELYDLARRERVGDLGAQSASVFALAFSSDGRYVASAARDGTVELWDVAGRRELALIHGSGETRMAFDVAFTDGDTKLYVAGSSGLLGAVDLSYLERHIAGNVAFHLHRTGADAPALREWAAGVLARGMPSPALEGPPAETHSTGGEERGASDEPARGARRAARQDWLPGLHR